MSAAGGRRALAVDIGGTKIAAGVVTQHGHVLRRSLQATPRERGAQDVLDAVCAAVSAVCEDGVELVGVGCGGPMRAAGSLVSPIHIPAWKDFPLKAELERRLARRVTVDNDAKVFALGEGWCGAAAGERNYLGMVVSTGVGGGIVVDGRLLDGQDANAGHIGHVVVEPDGRPCHCGGRGCLASEAGGLAIAQWSGSSPEDASSEVIQRVGTLVGRALASVLQLLDLRVAVVGGSVALGFGEPFFGAVRAEFAARARLDYARDVRILASQLGGDAGLIGAAALAFSKERS